MTTPYTPPGTESLETRNTTKRLMVGIFGAPKTGKTTSAATFPNPIFADFDDGLIGHSGSKVNRLLFHDPKWVKEFTKQTNIRDGWLVFLDKEAPKLTEEQTLVVDTWTTLQDAFDIQTDKEPVLTKSGQIDEFAFWGRKQDFSRDVMNGLKGLKCNVVVLFHETVQRDAKGEMTSKMQPVMQGRFSDKLPLYFSDWFRQIARDIKKKDPVTNKEVVVGIEYLWQVRSDNLANCATRMKHLPLTTSFVAADYTSLKY